MRPAGALLAAAWILCGCAALPELGAHSAALLEFELAGRIAVRYGDQAVSGNVAWRHARVSDEMLITSPVGGAVARIVRDRAGVTLTDANGEEHRAADAQSLTERFLGFRLPLEGLADWVRARPTAGAQAVAQYDAAGRLASLEQDGWYIEYLEYDPALGGALPARMRLQYPGLDLRIAIHRWKAG